jgi:glycosyltransferase involved in cell wall biosynthesis
VSRRPRICFVLPSLNGGGAERAAVTILNGLEESAWDRSMYLFRREGPYLGELSPSVKLSSGRQDSRGARVTELRRYFRETRPDVIVSFLSYFTVLLGARLSGISTRIVFNQQTPMSAFLEDADYHWRRPWRRRVFTAVTRLGFGRADIVVTTSRGVADDLCERFGVKAGAIRVVHNPVDLARIHQAMSEPLDESLRPLLKPPVMIAAGRLAEAKNFPLLVDAMAVLRTRVPARLVILGEGEQEGLIRERIAHHRLSESVYLCGFQSNPWRYFASATLFVLTSRYEGFGNVLVEAMACGIPVVATASPGTREIIEHGLNGLLVEEHTAEALAGALEEVLTNASYHERLAGGARASAAQYDVPVIARQYELIFREMAA